MENEKNKLRSHRKTVMLHYLNYGKQRSPSDQFDMLLQQKEITDSYNFVILNQNLLPRDVGSLRVILDLKRKIEKEKPDIIHISGVKEGFHCMVAAILAGCHNRILITHGFSGLAYGQNPIKKVVFRWIIEPLTLLMATSVQCNSQFSYDVTMVRLFAKKKRLIAYNYLKKVKVSSPYWRKAHEIPDDTVIISTIGNMYPGKGYDILSKVITNYKAQERVKFVVMGDGELQDKFVEENKRYIANGKLLFLGKVEHTMAMQILSESDIFFLPTRFETLGMVFAEAGEYGIPSVATDLKAIKEIVIDQNSGYLAHVDDVDMMIKRLDELINDPIKRVKFGKNAKIQVSKVFDARKTTQKILEMYLRA